LPAGSVIGGGRWRREPAQAQSPERRSSSHRRRRPELGFRAHTMLREERSLPCLEHRRWIVDAQWWLGRSATASVTATGTEHRRPRAGPGGGQRQPRKLWFVDRRRGLEEGSASHRTAETVTTDGAESRRETRVWDRRVSKHR
jgi:hypothetical protein